ncbi:MAG: DEAD/DEAH box helicase family protein [Myxococcales bacterium]|nr:DEAD/DEAH box helicase family protein [Myxococcales bacterium]
MPLLPMWEGESPEEGAETLPPDVYQVVLAQAAHRVAGELASALRRGDGQNASRLAAKLRALVTGLDAAPAASGLTPSLRAGWAIRQGDADPAAGARLFSSETPSLFDGLRAVAWNARELDIVVAYAQPAGVSLLRQLLERLVHRGARVRILLGAYLDGTHPDALRQLKELLGTGASASIRFVPDRYEHFHPKVYRVLDDAGREHLFVGSANLSYSALTGSEAVEWTLGIDESTAPALVALGRARVDMLLTTRGEPLTDQLISEYDASRRRRVLPPDDIIELDLPRTSESANAAQVKALEALVEVRRAGHQRALVVAATGLGKTVLAALDSLVVAPSGRVLFVAHRQEILLQARRTFERFRADGTCGLFNQYEKAIDARHVFASVFSLDAVGAAELTHFDYVVIDEAHHASAQTYRDVLGRVSPTFVLGLTATPERLDGGNIYELFDNVVAYEAGMLDAIANQWLVPFHYYGLPDPVDYSKLRWVGGTSGYAQNELESALVDRERLERVTAALTSADFPGSRSLVFCVGIGHAAQTAESLRQAGLRVALVHSGPGSDDRAWSVDALSRGDLDAIVSVDVFNEGVDIPAVDRVVLLRPTDSATVYLQQIGRGLRLCPEVGKSTLTVIDFVGNHKRARVHFDLLGMSLDDVASAVSGTALRRSYSDGRVIYVAPEALDAVRAVHVATRGTRARVDEAFDLARDELDVARPSLLDVASRCGLSPTTLVRLYGSWLDYLGQRGALSADDRALKADSRVSALLLDVETTAMSGPHKMVLLGAMADRGVTRVTMAELAGSLRRFVEVRHPAAIAHISQPAWASDTGLANNLRENPAHHLSKSHPQSFGLEDGVFELLIPAGVEATLVLAAVAERTEARLYDFLRHRPTSGAEVVGSVIKQGRGLTLNVAKQRARLPPAETWIPLRAQGATYFGKVMAKYINVIARKEDGTNEATQFLLEVVAAATVEQALGRTVRLTPSVEQGRTVWLLEAT